MHELSISSAIVDTVERHAEGRRVTVVSLRLGRMRQVVPDSLAFYFEIVARDSVCEGARLDQQLIDALLRCRGCGAEWDPGAAAGARRARRCLRFAARNAERPSLRP